MPVGGTYRTKNPDTLGSFCGCGWEAFVRIFRSFYHTHILLQLSSIYLGMITSFLFLVSSYIFILHALFHHLISSFTSTRYLSAFFISFIFLYCFYCSFRIFILETDAISPAGVDYGRETCFNSIRVSQCHSWGLTGSLLPDNHKALFWSWLVCSIVFFLSASLQRLCLLKHIVLCMPKCQKKEKIIGAQIYITAVHQFFEQWNNNIVISVIESRRFIVTVLFYTFVVWIYFL